MTTYKEPYKQKGRRELTELAGLAGWIYTLRQPYNVERNIHIEETASVCRIHCTFREKTMKENNPYYMQVSREQLVYSNQKIGYHMMVEDSNQYADHLNDRLGRLLVEEEVDPKAIRLELQGEGMKLEEPRQGYNRETFMYRLTWNKQALKPVKLHDLLPKIAQEIYTVKEEVKIKEKIEKE